MPDSYRSKLITASVTAEELVTSVIEGHNILHIAEPSGQSGSVILSTMSNGIHNRATVRSDTARLTRRKFRVVRMRFVPNTTKQTKIFPMVLTANIMANKVNCRMSNHEVLFETALFVELVLIFAMEIPLNLLEISTKNNLLVTKISDLIVLCSFQFGRGEEVEKLNCEDSTCVQERIRLRIA